MGARNRNKHRGNRLSKNTFVESVPVLMRYESNRLQDTQLECYVSWRSGEPVLNFLFAPKQPPLTQLSHRFWQQLG